MRDIMSASDISSDQFNSNSEDSALDISCVYSNNDFPLTEVVQIEVIEAASISQPLPVLKHTNLDAKPLTLYEQIHLIRIYYFTVPHVIRSITIMACVVLFGFNLSSILMSYYHRNTLVIVDYITPNVSVFPAFTICTECILCYNSSNFSIVPRIFYTTDILENDMVLAMLDERGIERFTDNKKVPSFDVRIDCAYYNDTISTDNFANIQKNCLKLTKIKVSMQGGSKCWTLFSNIYGKENDDLKLVFDYTPQFQFRFRGQWFYGPSTNVYFSVHNPNVLPGMADSRYHKLTPGKLIDYRFSKEIWSYEQATSTDHQCFQYREGDLNYTSKLPEELDKNVFSTSYALFSEDGIPIYRSGIECYQYCLWRKLYNKTTSTINLWADFAVEMTQRYHFLLAMELIAKESQKWKDHTNRIDDSDYWIKFGPFSKDASIVYTNEKEKCLKMCPHPCRMDNFNEAVVQILDNKENTAAYVLVSWAVKATNVITYKNDADLVEIIGVACGTLHVFLKISAVTVIIYLVNLIKLRQFSLLFRCCLINWLQRRRDFESMNSLNA